MRSDKKSRKSQEAPELPEIKDLASAIRARRKSLGLTQAQLGRFAGCGPVFIHELELGKPTVRLSKVLDVLKILGLQLALEEGKKGLVVSDQLAVRQTEESGG